MVCIVVFFLRLWYKYFKNIEIKIVILKKQIYIKQEIL